MYKELYQIKFKYLDLAIARGFALLPSSLLVDFRCTSYSSHYFLLFLIIEDSIKIFTQNSVNLRGCFRAHERVSLIKEKLCFPQLFATDQPFTSILVLSKYYESYILFSVVPFISAELL